MVMYVIFKKVNIMKLVIITNNKARINKLFDWLIHMVGYALILISISIMVGEPHFSVSGQYFGFWAFLGAVIIYVLNKTVRPILFYLTLPITGLTLGLFYPFINVFILYITSYILGDKFHIEGIFTVFLIAVLISIMNIILENIVSKSILKRSVIK